MNHTLKRRDERKKKTKEGIQKEKHFPQMKEGEEKIHLTVCLDPIERQEKRREKSSS